MIKEKKKSLCLSFLPFEGAMKKRKNFGNVVWKNLNSTRMI